MSVSITLSIRLGPLVSLRVNGQSCHELAKALEGYDIMDAMREENEENEEGKEEEEER